MSGYTFKDKPFFWRFKTGQLSDKIRDSDQCIVQRSHNDGKRSFSFFNNWETFLYWYTNLAESDRTFCEVLRPHSLQKFRIDIDCDALSHDKNEKHHLLHTILKSFDQALKSSSDISPKILVYESISPNNNARVSLHLVSYNLCSIADGCLNVAKLTAKLSGHLGHFVDLSIYKSFQCFRMEGSRKAESEPRYKFLIAKYENDLLIKLKLQLLSPLFLDGILTYVTNCNTILVPDSSLVPDSTPTLSTQSTQLTQQPSLLDVAVCSQCGQADIVHFSITKLYKCSFCKGSFSRF